MAGTYAMTWNLDNIFAGGIDSPALAAALERLESGIAQLRPRTEGLAPPDTPAALDEWSQVLTHLTDLYDLAKETGSFVICLRSDNTRDRRPALLLGRVAEVTGRLEAIYTLLLHQGTQVPDATWDNLLQDPRLAPVAQPLAWARRRARTLMEPAREELATDLQTDGPQAWNSLYHTVVGRLTVQVERGGGTEQLAVSQAFNLLFEPDPAVRRTVFAGYEHAFAGEADVLAAALNAIAGFRLTLYRHRGWSSVLQEPLDLNRISASTLEAMWAAVEGARPQLVAYLRRKAALLGSDALDWCDLKAPLGTDPGPAPYDQTAAFIVEQFAGFSPQLAELAETAFRSGWVEAEDRPGKRPGGFATYFPLAREPRIFLTYGGRSFGERALAHELGHAFHFHTMRDVSPLARDFGMSLAETASTFAEMLVGSAAIARAHDPGQRLRLLDTYLGDSVTFLMDVYARYQFELAFYERRQRGPVDAEDLNQLMLAAEQEAFGYALGSYHPYMWAAKGHFYRDPPFYNFPYTFGHLFSAGLLARARAEGPGFEPRYVELLRDTGRMSVEGLAARYLDVDLAQRAFWDDAVRIVTADVDEFLRLTTG